MTRRRRGAPSATELPLFGAEEFDALLASEAGTVESRRSARRTSGAERRAAAAEIAEISGVAEPTIPYDGSLDEQIPGASPASAVPVSVLTATAKDVLEGAFVPLWVRGEVSDFKAHRNGHWYFCLRDDRAQIKCVVWARDQRRMYAPPDDGMQVVALGQVTVYATRGDLQFSVKAMDAEGDGLWRKALEQTRLRLDADGLLDVARKRPIPRFPRRIAVVTSPDGAALHDIVSVVRRRCATVEIVVVAAKVQGDGAPEELCAALERLGRWSSPGGGDEASVDCVIIGRGGGAREDLWAFNDERVVRAVAACPVPVISAVGHEIDVTLCDLVADLRAATPSAAAEAAVPVLAEMLDELRGLGATLSASAGRCVQRKRDLLRVASRSLSVTAERATERRRAVIEQAAGRLHALSPLATLSRGYGVARSVEGDTLGSVRNFTPGLPFHLLLRDGAVRAIAEEAARGAPLTAAMNLRRAEAEE